MQTRTRQSWPHDHQTSWTQRHAKTDVRRNVSVNGASREHCKRLKLFGRLALREGSKGIYFVKDVSYRDT